MVILGVGICSVSSIEVGFGVGGGSESVTHMKWTNLLPSPHGRVRPLLSRRKIARGGNI